MKSVVTVVFGSLLAFSVSSFAIGSPSGGGNASANSGKYNSSTSQKKPLKNIMKSKTNKSNQGSGGAANDGAANGGAANDGATSDGAANGGATSDGAANGGAAIGGTTGEAGPTTQVQ